MLMKKAINILGVPVTPFSMEEAVSFLMDRIAKKMPTQVVTANAEIIMMARNDKRYGTLLQQADLVLADGAGTVWAGRTLGYEVPERVAGFDLFVELIKKSAEEGIKLYFFGAAPGIAEAAKAKAEMLAPGVSIVGTRNGYFSETDIEEIIDEINASGAQILFAALGAPKQEYWLRDHAKQLRPLIRIGLGGSFDVLAGKTTRAPHWMQKASLEWLYRLYKEPSRIGRMMALPRFVLVVQKEKRTHK